MTLSSPVPTKLGVLTVNTHFRRDWIRYLLSFTYWKGGTYSGEISGNAVARGREEQLARDGGKFDTTVWEAAKTKSFPVDSQRGLEKDAWLFHENAREIANHFAINCCTSHPACA